MNATSIPTSVRMECSASSTMSSAVRWLGLMEILSIRRMDVHGMREPSSRAIVENSARYRSMCVATRGNKSSSAALLHAQWRFRRTDDMVAHGRAGARPVWPSTGQRQQVGRCCLRCPGLGVRCGASRSGAGSRACLLPGWRRKPCDQRVHHQPHLWRQRPCFRPQDMHGKVVDVRVRPHGH